MLIGDSVPLIHVSSVSLGNGFVMMSAGLNLLGVYKMMKWPRSTCCCIHLRRMSICFVLEPPGDRFCSVRDMAARLSSKIATRC